VAATSCPGNSRKQITSDIGPLAKVKEDLTQAGVTHFGSGWCWLAVKDRKIVVMKTPNGENPLVHAAKAILGCDVGEHSYYIDYRNRRPDHLKAFLDHLVWHSPVHSPWSEATEYSDAGQTGFAVDLVRADLADWYLG
jgi:superoxide dismutase, Fe-Mn family